MESSGYYATTLGLGVYTQAQSTRWKWISVKTTLLFISAVLILCSFFRAANHRVELVKVCEGSFYVLKGSKPICFYFVEILWIYCQNFLFLVSTSRRWVCLLFFESLWLVKCSQYFTDHYYYNMLSGDSLNSLPQLNENGWNEFDLLQIYSTSKNNIYVILKPGTYSATIEKCVCFLENKKLVLVKKTFHTSQELHTFLHLPRPL